MKMVSIKSVKEAGVPGIEFVFVDKNITEVVIGKLRIRKGESYTQGLQVLVEAPFETAERYRVTGKIEGFPDAVSYFEGEYEAKTVGAKLEGRGATVAVERIDALIDDDGFVVADAANDQNSPTAPPLLQAADMPF